MMKKNILLGMLIVLVIGTATAQHTKIFTNPDLYFNQGKEFFNQRKFAASFRSFESFLNTTEKTQAGQIQEADYYLAANAYELRQNDAAKRLKNYLAKHPYTPFFDKTQLMLGMLVYESKKYSQALTYFNQVNDKRLGDRERVDFMFCKGYACLETRNYKQALVIFKELKTMKTRYDLSATYYYAYSEYTLGNHAAALPEFLKIEDNPKYKNIVPYYIIQIYYAQKEYDKLYQRADLLLKNNPDNPNNGEIFRIMGEIAYSKKEYAKAISYFSDYEKITPQVLRNDMYLFGLSYYQLSDYQNTIKYLSKTTTQKDEMTENAYLHIGMSNIKIKDITNARLAFEAALQTTFNKVVREEALYNYALCTYETTSAFGESISAFEQLFKEFPNSKYLDSASEYLATVYMSSKNFEAAYKSILNIKQPNSKLIETKEYIVYQIGTEAFMQNNFRKAIDYFTLNLQSSTTGKYSAESLFWRSESNFKIGDNDKSITDLNAFFRNQYSKSSANYKIANYSLAYAYFTKKNYSEALNWFTKYTDIERNNQASTYTDALNRIGDCYFYNRNFSQAEANYTKAASYSPNTGDYAVFQSAYVAGLQKNYTTKITRLESLITKYPNSEYIDDAFYEMGRAYIMIENDNKAIATFQRLVSLQPNSAMARKASLEIGMIYFNQNNFDQAIDAYKKVISNYSGTEEAYTALESLESVYIEKNDVQSYLAYTKTLGMKLNNNSSNREDSISYIASEKQYMNGNYKQAIIGLNSYLKNFCSGGRYCTNAQYFLADSYYRTNEKDKAFTAYNALLQINGNQFMQEAATRCAEITYDNKDYENSLKYFKLLQTLAQNNEKKNVARLGILRCSYFLNDHNNTITIANEIITDMRSSAELIAEARYNRAKAYIAQNNQVAALSDLSLLANDTRTANGAESKYLISKIYFDQNKLSNAENEVLDFAKKNTPHQFWLARSFVLLSDIYIIQKNDFQAKQYLLSLQKNYKGVDEIQGMITERLDAIKSRENQTIINR